MPGVRERHFGDVLERNWVSLGVATVMYVSDTVCFVLSDEDVSDTHWDTGSVDGTMDSQEWDMFSLVEEDE